MDQLSEIIHDLSADNLLFYEANNDEIKNNHLSTDADGHIDIYQIQFIH